MKIRLNENQIKFLDKKFGIKKNEIEKRRAKIAMIVLQKIT